MNDAWRMIYYTRQSKESYLVFGLNLSYPFLLRLVALQTIKINNDDLQIDPALRTVDFGGINFLQH